VFLCNRDGLTNPDYCQNLKSGTAWLTIPENGEFVLVLISTTCYSNTLCPPIDPSPATVRVSNVEVSSVISELGNQADLTIAPGDPAYVDGAEFRAFATVWPGMDIPIDWLSRTASLEFKSQSDSWEVVNKNHNIIPSAPNTGWLGAKANRS
jgi:hypothetical protein